MHSSKEGEYAMTWEERRGVPVDKSLPCNFLGKGWWDRVNRFIISYSAGLQGAVGQKSTPSCRIPGSGDEGKEDSECRNS